MLPKRDCTAWSTTERLLTAVPTSLHPEICKSSSVPLMDKPKRGDRIRPNSVTRMASSHRGHSVEKTTTGCVPIARTLLDVAEEVEPKVARHVSFPEPLAVPTYAPTVSETPSATSASEVGSHRMGPTVADGTDWKRATPGVLALSGASGPAGDRSQARLAIITPPLSDGQRLSAKATGAATRESDTATAYTASLEEVCCSATEEKRSAYGSRDELGVRVCVAACKVLAVRDGVEVTEAVTEVLGDFEGPAEVNESDGEALEICDEFCEGADVTVTLALCVWLSVALGVTVAEGENVIVTDGVEMAVTLALCVWLSVALGVTVAEGENVIVTDGVEVTVTLALCVLVLLCEAVCVIEELCVRLAVIVCE